MSMTFGQAVKEARRARMMSQSALARIVGTTQSSIDRVERDESARSRAAPEIAAALGLPFPYPGGSIAAAPFNPTSARALEGNLPNRSTPSNEALFPIYAAAEGGRGTMVVSPDPIDTMPQPSIMKNVNDGFGVLVVGESMFPAYEPGDIALINPRLPFMRDTDVVLVSGEAVGEFTASIKRLISWDENDWTVRQWNPPSGELADFSLPRKTWQKALRVIGKYARR